MPFSSLPLRIGTINFVFDEVQALMAAVAVCAFMLLRCQPSVRLLHGILHKHYRGRLCVSQILSGCRAAKFLLILKVKLEGVTDFAVRGKQPGTEVCLHKNRTVWDVIPTVVRGGRSELWLSLSGKSGDQFSEFCSKAFFGLSAILPAAGRTGLPATGCRCRLLNQTVTRALVGTRTSHPSM